METAPKKSRKGLIIALILLAVLLFASLAQNIYYLFWGFDSYLQSTDEIAIMEAGILKRFETFGGGEDHPFSYDMANEAYPALLADYGLDAIAGTGSELERALRLMDEYAPRLKHKSNYDNHVPMTAPDLLAYALDKPANGINCRAKAQILNEMCLSLGIFARKVWIMPLSPYDNDCHVVNEVWDTDLNKWVMLDITNDQYWVDENGTPLSVLELRTLGAEQAFCTPVCPGDSLEDLLALKNKYLGNYLYIMKNLFYTQYCDAYGVGEIRPIWCLIPGNAESDYEYRISEEAVNRPPV